MALTGSDGRGYIIPSVMDPEDAVCIRVYVPADQLYIAAFFGALEHFGKWVAWEKDDSHRAKDVAEVWRTWIKKTRDEWDCGGGDCGIMNVRQKPGEPCILERQLCCAGAWEQFADLRLCAFGIDDMLYEEGESWKEIDDILWQLKSWIEQIDAWLTAGKDAVEIKYLMASQIGWIMGLDTIINNMAAMSAGDRTTAIAALDWDDIRASVYCDSGSCWPVYGDISTYYAWLDCLSDWLFGALNDTANALFDSLNVGSDWIIDTLNLAPVARAAGGSGFGSEKPSCIKTAVFDWTLGDKLGWELTDPGLCAKWVGNGWAQAYPDTPYDAISIKSPALGAMTVRHVEIKLSEELIGNNPGAQFTDWTYAGGVRVYGTGGVDGEFNLIADMVVTVGGIVINVDCNYGDSQPFAAILRKATIYYE